MCCPLFSSFLTCHLFPKMLPEEQQEGEQGHSQRSEQSTGPPPSTLSGLSLPIPWGQHGFLPFPSPSLTVHEENHAVQHCPAAGTAPRLCPCPHNGGASPEDSPAASQIPACRDQQALGFLSERVLPDTTGSSGCLTDTQEGASGLCRGRGQLRCCQPPTHPPAPWILQRSLPVFFQTLPRPGILRAVKRNCSNNSAQLLVQRHSWG